MTTLDISTPYAAIHSFRRAIEGEFDNYDFDSIEVGAWANPQIHIPSGNSDITAPYMEAFLATQHALYIIVAELIYGEGDVRKLSSDEIERYRIRFYVSKGSSNLVESIGETLTALAKDAVGKLSAKQIVMLIAGGALLISGSYGFTSYLEYRKEVRVQELRSEERKLELENQRYALEDQVEVTKYVADKLTEQGEVMARMVEESNKTNFALLRAIAQTDDAVVNGTSVSKSEADLLRHNKRRRSDEAIVNEMVRVVDINTTNNAQTTVELSGLSQDNVKVTFADRMIEDRDLSKLHRSLKDRKPVRVRLQIRKVGDEIRSAEILKVTTPRTRT